MAWHRRGGPGWPILAVLLALSCPSSLVAQTPGRPPGEKVSDSPSILASAAAEGCLDLPWSERRRVFEGGRLVAARCAVTDFGTLLPGDAPGWRWALYRRTAVYEAGPDRAPEAVRLFPDTLREDELVLFLEIASEAPGRPVSLQPVWHDRSDAMAELLRPPRAAPLPARAATGILLAHRRCLSGTGGCADHPFWLSQQGAVTPLHPAYATELAGRLPEGWGTWKGVWLDPAHPRTEAAVYLPEDANCCPTFSASAHLQLLGDALHLDSLELVPSEESFAWRVVPGTSFGYVDGATSEEELAGKYAPGALEPAELQLAEGICTPGTRVFPATPWQMEVAWADSARSRPAFVRVGGTGGPWWTPGGVRLGATLAELEARRDEPISFSGFGWEHGGEISWEEDDGRLRLRVGPDSASKRRLHGELGREPRAEELFGERTVRSDHPLVRELTIRVERITIEWASPAMEGDCEPPGGD